MQLIGRILVLTHKLSITTFAFRIAKEGIRKTSLCEGKSHGSLREEVRLAPNSLL